MRDGDRINVGLFVNSIQNDYSTLMCQGAAIAAEELDVNLIIVPGRELNATWDNIAINRFEHQSSVLYSYINSSNVDVLLVSMGTVGFFLDEAQRKEFLSRYSDIKVIVLESEVEGYPSILFDMKGLRDEIEHLIKVHGKRKIAFLSGPANNAVAAERLELFRQIMKENDIQLDESYIGYGDFTDYCEKMVEAMFDGFSDGMPEALVCANDTMVKSVKNICQERGIQIGSDLLVVGYDDAPFAGVMVPSLTTVKSNIMSMGYRAVVSAVNYCKTGVFEKTSVETSLILRQSCGCITEEVRGRETRDITIEHDRKKLIHNILDYAQKKSSLDIIPPEQIAALRKFIGEFYDRLSEGKQFSSTEISIMIADLMSDENMDFLTYDAINAVMYALKKIALESSDEADYEKVYMTFERIFRQISLQFAEKSHSVETRMITDRFVFSRIADDMMASSNDENEAFSHLMNDIRMLHVKSCYIYLYHKSLIGQTNSPDNTSEWKRPDHIYIRAVYENDRFVFPQPKDQRMMYDSFFTNKFVPHNKRKTAVLQALYFNDEHYGIMLVETRLGIISEVMNISKQICTAIKLSQFMNQLEGALENVRQANIKLSAESVSDQLTGIYNRRGFITESEKILKRRSGMSCRGAVVFADLDCLKTINDTFGHKEGDFAICKASEILVNSLRTTDVLGRVGGDEFVAFIMDIDEAQLQDLCRRIKDAAAAFNAASDKPYNIGISMGVYSFDTSDGETIDQLMSAADRDLYNSKKTRSRNILKEN